MPSFRSHDHRGRHVRIIGPGLLDLVRTPNRSTPAGRAAAAVPKGLKRRVCVWVICLILLTVVITRIAIGMYRMGNWQVVSLEALQSLLWFGLVIIGSAVGLVRDIAKARELMTEAALRDQACPCCGYSLRDISPSDGSCTVCPECSAAWVLPLART